MNDTGREQIAVNFAAYFQNWEIHLPDGWEAPGGVSKAGWHIRWIVGSDEDGEYLELLASHRMTNERRLRLYASGEQRSMPSTQEMMVYSADATEEEKQSVEVAYYAHNRAIGEELRRIGLITDDD